MSKRFIVEAARTALLNRHETWYGPMLSEACDEIENLRAAIRAHHANVADLGLNHHGQGNYAWGGPFDWELWQALDLPIHPPMDGSPS